jgi:hypothetical protein
VRTTNAGTIGAIKSKKYKISFDMEAPPGLLGCEDFVAFIPEGSRGGESDLGL